MLNDSSTLEELSQAREGQINQIRQKRFAQEVQHPYRGMARQTSS